MTKLQKDLDRILHRLKEMKILLKEDFNISDEAIAILIFIINDLEYTISEL